MTMNGARQYFCVFFLLFLASCGAPTQQSTEQDSSEVKADLWGDKFDTQRIRIASFDGTELAAILFTPKVKYFPGARPGLIFVNSWVLTEDEYDVQARKFAQKGYVVLSYATRGFSSSGGVVTVSGPNDLRDVSTMIDWMEENTNLDVTRLGMAGVSYGAGISLMAVANDPRVKTAVAMSGWGNLEQSLYGNETIREVWLNLLLISGKILGRLDDEIGQQVKRLKTNTEADIVRAWAADRSPLTYIDKINARKAPIMVANSYQDALFPPTQMRTFYEKLQGPKQFYLDKGIHASSAVPGLFGLPSAIWTETHRWFDHYLMSESNGLAAQGPISMQTPRGREYMDAFPGLITKQRSTTLRAVNRTEDLGDPEPSFDGLESLAGISFTASVDSGATSGIPLISDTVDATINLPVVKLLTLVDRRYAAMYMTDFLTSTTRLRGSPQIKFWTTPHSKPQQLVAYLYDTDAFARGTLISHGVISERDPSTQTHQVTLDLNIAAYDVPMGHRLVLVIDSRDPLYTNYASERYPVELVQDGTRVVEMALPLVQ